MCLIRRRGAGTKEVTLLAHHFPSPADAKAKSRYSSDGLLHSSILAVYLHTKAD